MDLLDKYQNAAEFIVLFVYAVVVVATLAGAVAALRFFFGKRVGRTDATDVTRHDSD